MFDLEALNRQICACTLCPLSANRTQAVPGEGSASARIMFIGEGPGYHEDRQGRPFVGPAGQLLDSFLASIGLKRSQVYITNMIKCRPPNNRDPLPGEIKACSSYLDRQLATISPKVVVTLGRYSFGKFFPGESISKARGKARMWNGVTIYPIYHPAAALHNPGLMSALEADFKKLPEILRQAEAAAQAPAPAQAAQPEQLSLL